jgi:hypothetical protein
MFGILLSGACAAAQMSPEQYATITSRIKARIQEPLLLVDGLHAELAGKEELAAELQSASELNAELVQAAAAQTTLNKMKMDDALQNRGRMRGNLEEKIRTLEAQIDGKAIHYKCVFLRDGKRERQRYADLLRRLCTNLVAAPSPRLCDEPHARTYVAALGWGRDKLRDVCDLQAA